MTYKLCAGSLCPNDCYRIYVHVYGVPHGYILSVCQCDVRSHGHLREVPVKSRRCITCVTIHLFFNIRAKGQGCHEQA